MDLKERAEALAEELKVDFDKIHLVIGVTSVVLEGAFNGHKKSVEAVTKFFTDRQAAFDVYSEEQIEIIRSFERSIPNAGSASKAAEKIGLNAAIISGLRKNNYRGNSDKKFSELASYFKIKDAKKELPDVFIPVDYAPTTISQMIYQRLRNVKGVFIIPKNQESEEKSWQKKIRIPNPGRIRKTPNLPKLKSRRRKRKNRQRTATTRKRLLTTNRLTKMARVQNPNPRKSLSRTKKPLPMFLKCRRPTG